MVKVFNKVHVANTATLHLDVQCIQYNLAIVSSVYIYMYMQPGPSSYGRKRPGKAPTRSARYFVEVHFSAASWSIICIVWGIHIDSYLSIYTHQCLSDDCP